ncbi:NAD(P)-dependent alcohol dehydrogenase [Zobellia roscoffensis]|uniref:NAD(P)-dependent alcohol dehydrogenase n=1 Tax=Zobellia roscoffensis TaxID=2779508 RepID=UPI00188B91EC|nr:NAD(P)-dependent alcohol dehydrogenase [Zobellia roscoffensis]
MKAAIYTKYGPPEVFKITEVKKPLPKDNEVLIKIHAATVTSGDVRLRSSDFPALFWLPARLIFGLFKPKKSILGHELSGVVEDKGKNATKFEVGDHVFGTTTMLSGGSYAEYVCLPQEWKHGVVTHKPKNINFQEAAALPIGAMTAMFLLEKANLSKNQKVLIYGASGSVGSYAAQLAKYHGATVTGVCSGSNFEMVKSLGADHLIDYKKTDYSNLEDKFDIIFDAVGKTSKSHAKKVLKKDGKFISVKMLTKEKPEHLKKIKELAETGELKPFIDKVYSIYDIVDAHTYVDQGHKRGNVVIDLLS